MSASSAGLNRPWVIGALAMFALAPSLGCAPHLPGEKPEQLGGSLNGYLFVCQAVKHIDSSLV